MKPNKIIYLFLSAALIFGGLTYFSSTTESYAATAQASKKKSSKSSSKRNKKSSSSKKSKNSKSKKESSSKRNSRNRRGSSSGSSNTRKRTQRSSSYSAPKAETPQNDSLTLAVNEAMLKRIPKDQNSAGLRVNSVKLNKTSKTANISLNENFTYLPVTQAYISELQRYASKSLPDSIQDYRVNLSCGGHPLSYYINSIDKLPEKYRKNPPFVVPAHPYVNAKKGMEGDIIALWSSHGRYFKNGGWAWQRPMLFEAIEDTYTMSYVVPFLLPMLENAGAYPIMPRERDTNPHEVIVDNDTNDEGEIYSQPYFKYTNGTRKWRLGDGEGFIYDLPDFRDTENPFENGTYWEVNTIRSGKQSVAAWYADIPEDGEYAVYVSYKTLPNSTEDAHYTVNYSGGSREFKVNQTMGGGTWVYLGTFPLEAGYSDEEPVVTLTNLSDKGADKVVTADAVKLGGGMGNIARSRNRSDIYYDPSTPEKNLAQNTPDSEEDVDAEDRQDEGDDEDVDTEDESGDAQPGKESAVNQPAQVRKGRAPTFTTSGLPRYLEGARYWMHWAGFPEKVYSPFHGSNDYKDDYTGRGHWVNYLAGGSRVLPDREGLHIPVDLSFALHSDAGKRGDDSYVGTLGIYYTNGGASYVDGTPRKNSRFFTDMLMRQITGDIRKLYEPNWTRRSMWDKSYLEARVPEVPTSLIELMSHQNFSDMQYGLDPNFRFDVARSIYKGMARFLAERKGRGEVVIQPLPVKDFAIKRKGKDTYRLSWAPTPDPIEPTAMPNKYVVFERSGDDLGFHKIGETGNTHFDVKVSDHDIHSFRIVAANDGGLSFPSETLALREGSGNSQPILIVNGFTRVSGPGNFNEGGRAGFNSEDEFMVPYGKDVAFTGHQTEFRKGAGNGFGRSSGNYINMVIPGNTFDFVMVHGRAIANTDRGFVSCSAKAVEDGLVNLNDYKVVDLILGKQKATVIGRGKAQKSSVNYIAFPAKLQKALKQFVGKGGSLMASGQYIASDLESAYAPAGSVEFGEHVLGIVRPENAERPGNGRLSGSHSRSIGYYSTINDKNYHIERPEALQPAEGVTSSTLLKYSDTGDAAALLNNVGHAKVAVMSVPFETIKDADDRNAVMSEILNFLAK